MTIREYLQTRKMVIDAGFGDESDGDGGIRPPRVVRWRAALGRAWRRIRRRRRLR